MFRLINGGEKLPQRATRFSAGFDVFANEDIFIGAGETKLIGLGIALDLAEILRVLDIQAIPMGEFVEDFMETYYFMLCLRSSLGAKGLILPNGHGVIDMDYRDEIKMIIHNPISKIQFGEMIQGACGLNQYKIELGDKIGQLILCRHEGYLLPSEYTLDAERHGGFGSTNITS